MSYAKKGEHCKNHIWFFRTVENLRQKLNDIVLGDWGRGTREQRRGNLNGFHHLAGLDNKVIITIVATATIQYPWVELAPWCANRISLSQTGRRQGGDLNLCHYQLFRIRNKFWQLSKINIDCLSSQPPMAWKYLSEYVPKTNVNQIYNCISCIPLTQFGDFMYPFNPVWSFIEKFGGQREASLDLECLNRIFSCREKFKHHPLHQYIKLQLVDKYIILLHQCIKVQSVDKHMT